MKRVHKRQVERDPEKGAVVVELAVMLPLLVIFLVVIVDLGLLLREHQILQNAAREGARLSSLPRNQVAAWNPSASLDTIRQRVVDYLAEENIAVAPESVSVRQDRVIAVGGESVTASEVTVAYTRDPLIGFLSPGPVSLSSQSVFRNLY